MSVKYTLEQIINQPRDKVIELIDNPDNLKEWQPGFISLEHISGVPSLEGAKSKLTYVMGKRQIVMIETINKKDLPHRFDLTFDADNVYNIQSNRFEIVDENTTKWISENEFILSGFMKIFGIFGKGMFKKQSQIYLDKFKEFAERS